MKFNGLKKIMFCIYALAVERSNSGCRRYEKDNDFTKGIERMHEWFEAHGYPFLIKGVVPEAAERIRALCPDCYEFTTDRDNYEYVYLTQDLINLSGKKFRQKKTT